MRIYLLFKEYLYAGLVSDSVLMQAFTIEESANNTCNNLNANCEDREQYYVTDTWCQTD